MWSLKAFMYSSGSVQFRAISVERDLCLHFFSRRRRLSSLRRREALIVDMRRAYSGEPSSLGLWLYMSRVKRLVTLRACSSLDPRSRARAVSSSTTRSHAEVSGRWCPNCRLGSPGPALDWSAERVGSRLCGVVAIGVGMLCSPGSMVGCRAECVDS